MRDVMRSMHVGSLLLSLLPTPLEAVEHTGRGVCLGNCVDCHTLLEALPRGHGEAAASHLDASKAGPEEILNFLEAPEVCNGEDLFPMSIDREFWSLAPMHEARSQLRFVGAEAAFRAATGACSSMFAVAVETFKRALAGAAACAGQHSAETAPASSLCGEEAVRQAASASLAQWQAAGIGSRPLEAAQGVETGFVAPEGNETLSVVVEYAARVHAELVGASGFNGRDYPSAAGLRRATQKPLAAFGAYRLLTALALQISRHARSMMENVRLTWAVKNLVVELSSVYPNVHEELPSVSFHTQVYGRHFDVLERLLRSLQDEIGQNRPLRMAEMGVACGPIGLHLLLRFPTMQYKGADPTITEPVFDAYRRFGERAQLNVMTSEDLHTSLPENEKFDMVFIDGPHTYANVRNDIKMWQPRVRKGGIIAGHDFTNVHPPLIWAVLEGRMQTGGSTVNVGTDGVWWWRVE
eukprot:TRINITY_DN55104_c0_g1_i1.p1 TRINITY_DN55104_c0_g1~~TRINITY_DN55104_c0_g1_i1.p1  ORF type:complete len:467 (+),score=98.84 TRINITY_DN55104_c0_g1_i1:121-1521(+)